jgi:hypothetical protein
MGTRRRRRIRRLRRATHDSTLTAGSTLKLIAVIVRLGPDTLGVALVLGIATESERGSTSAGTAARRAKRRRHQRRRWLSLAKTQVGDP